MNNFDSFRPFVRELSEGMGQAVGERTILRKKSDGSWETWEDVANRVALGNALLCPKHEGFKEEYKLLRHHISKAVLLMSGRHLQHGDETQPKRTQEVFVNCATAATSFAKFLLLLSGSGVGRCYDDDMMLIDWDNAPNLRCVLSHEHQDFDWSAHESVRDAQHKYGFGRNVIWHKVTDSREGWAKALELWEVMTFEKIHRDRLLVLDFSDVRPKGSPIGGMQNRPASGPVPLMNAFQKAATVKGAGLDPWRQTIYIDHFFSECLLVGGARRSARMSTKIYTDPTIFDFITVKRPIEFLGKAIEEIIAIRNEYAEKKMAPPMGFLWSSNNSIAVDAEFWRLLELKRDDDEYGTDKAKHARKVFKLATEAAYADGTGEPGFINVDKLTRNDSGWEELTKGDYVGSRKYQVDEDTTLLLARLARKARRKQYYMIVNPCVVGDTLVLTAEGRRTVTELINKPFTAIVDGKAYPATGFWKTGMKPVLEIITDRGYSLRVTANHKILVERSRKSKLGGGYNVVTEWVEAGSLTTGDNIVLNCHPNFSWKGDGFFEQGWLLGEMIGDGGYNPESYHGYVRFWGDQKEILAEQAFDFVREFLPKVEAPIPLQGPKYNKSNDTFEVECKALSNLAEGLIEPKTKDFLSKIHTMGSSFICGVLRGLFDADGTVLVDEEKGRSIRLSQTNLKRLHDVQLLLLNVGIASTVYKNRKSAGESLLPDGNGGRKLYETKSVHELVISKSNIPVFMERVGFYDTQKHAKAWEAIRSIRRGIYKEQFTAVVEQIVADGVEDVFDCTVDGVHAFDANGIMAHNCGEIPLSVLAGFCTIADVVPFHADTLDEAEDAFRTATRALIRVNLMESIYHKEVERTNRIGVGMTGVHEFAWKFFRVGFRDLINPDFEGLADMGSSPGYVAAFIGDPRLTDHILVRTASPNIRAAAFWMTLARFNRAVREESIAYSESLGVAVPHTCTTIKPSGSVSKLFGLTEGWHLPALAWMLRWVQFRNDDPLVEQYKTAGYPWRELIQYSGTNIIGFPTAPTIAELGMGDKLVLAGDATPEEQYRWLMLGEKFWLIGVDGEGEPVKHSYSGQISYTLKFKPEEVDYKMFKEMLIRCQSKVKACSVMPQVNNVAYEYLPEEAITKAEYEEVAFNISRTLSEDISQEHLQCENGACPIDVREGEKINLGTTMIH